MENTEGQTVTLIRDVTTISNTEWDNTFKVILIGDSSVGKSCIIKRLGTNAFTEEHEVTIGAEFTTLAAQTPNSSFKYQIWDSCGQERFNSITRIFYRGSQCVILVFDLSKQQSLQNLVDNWITDIKENLPDAFVILVGNKADLEDQRQVTKATALEMAEQFGISKYVECSAKTGDSVENILNVVHFGLEEKFPKISNDQMIEVEATKLESAKKDKADKKDDCKC